MPRPRVVVEDDDTLRLRPSWTSIVVAALFGVGMLVVTGFNLAYATTGFGLTLAGLVLAALGLGVAAWLARAHDYLLTIGPHGVSSPLTPQAPMLAWDTIARIGVGGLLLPGHLEVHIWRDPGDHSAGTRLGLFLTPGLAPMTSRRLRREIDQRRTRYSPHSPSGPTT